MTLEQRQKAGTEVEERVLAFLIQFSPAENLRVCDVAQIAHAARRIAFDAFSEKEHQP